MHKIWSPAFKIDKLLLTMSLINTTFSCSSNWSIMPSDFLVVLIFKSRFEYQSMYPKLYQILWPCFKDLLILEHKLYGSSSVQVGVPEYSNKFFDTLSTSVLQSYHNVHMFYHWLFQPDLFLHQSCCSMVLFFLFQQCWLMCFYYLKVFYVGRVEGKFVFLFHFHQFRRYCPAFSLGKLFPLCEHLRCAWCWYESLWISYPIQPILFSEISFSETNLLGPWGSWKNGIFCYNDSNQVHFTWRALFL